MHQTVRASTAAPVERLFEVVSDLATYPDWLDLVRRVEPAPPAPGDPGPAWFVTLRASIGPLARSKRLRMVQAHVDEARGLRFERREVDGRSHSDWVLTVEARALGSGSEVTMHLHYGGQLWGRALEAVLSRNVESGTARLRDLVGS